MPKTFGLFGLPLILALINLYVHFRFSNDPKQNNASKIVKAIGIWTIPVISILTPIIAYTTNEGIHFNMVSTINVFVGIMIVVIGNYLPKCKQNHTVALSYHGH